MDATNKIDGWHDAREWLLQNYSEYHTTTEICEAMDDQISVVASQPTAVSATSDLIKRLRILAARPDHFGMVSVRADTLVAAADGLERAASPLSAQPQAMPEVGALYSRIVELRAALRRIANTGFGWDGDCGVTTVAEDALYGDEQAEAAAPPSPQPVAESVKLSPVEIEDGRMYIPLPGGWEVQTKGKGSTFRLCHKFGPGADDYRRWMVLDEKLHKPLEAMALAMRTPAAALQPVARQDGEAGGLSVEQIRAIADTIDWQEIEWDYQAQEEFAKAILDAFRTAPAIEPVAGLTDAVDYKLLLAKYIEHVAAEEGATFADQLFRGSNGKWQGMSDRVEFDQLEKEAIDEAAAYYAGDQKGGAE